MHTGIFVEIVFTLAVFVLINIISTCCNTISTTTEKSGQDRHQSDIADSGFDCLDKFPPAFCKSVLESDGCDENDDNVSASHGCRRTCGFCDSGEVNASIDNAVRMYKTSSSYYFTSENSLTMHDDNDDDPKGGCEDKIPNCPNNLQYCCAMKEVMNFSCQKTCKFCSDSPIPPGTPVGVPVPTSTVSSSQDPCDPTKPPSVTANVPGQTTTTTQSPIGYPG